MAEQSDAGGDAVGGARVLRGIGIAGLLGGLLLAGTATAAGVQPGPSGFVAPIAVGYQAILLGGLAIGLSLPRGRRPAILGRPRLVVIAVVWSTVTTIVLAGGERILEVLRPVVEVLRPVVVAWPEARGAVVLVLTAAAGTGLIILIYGVLVTLVLLGLAAVRRLSALVRRQAGR